MRPPRAEDARLQPFAEPEEAPNTPYTEIDPGLITNRTVTRDFLARTVTMLLPRDGGVIRLDDIGLVLHEKGEVYHQITGDDPTSACSWTWFEMGRERGDWRIRTQTQTRLGCTATQFRLQATIDAWEGDKRVFARNWDLTIPRDML
jgi:hypothetical protein